MEVSGRRRGESDSRFPFFGVHLARFEGFELFSKLRILPEHDREIERRFEVADLAQVPDFTRLGTCVPLTVTAASPIVIRTLCVRVDPPVRIPGEAGDCYPQCNALCTPWREGLRFLLFSEHAVAQWQLDPSQLVGA